MQKLYMGNEAIGLGAIHAGVELVTGYPGTPSTEIVEFISKNNLDKSIYVEWSVNEKVAVEVAGGASMGGKRSLVTMKQVGLNNACDPVMNLSYIGNKAGLVIVVADDPGPISSQTEQDTREFGIYSKIPVLDPSSPEEAYAMVVYAFELSEMIEAPVIVRPTTRICHSVANFTPNLSLEKNEEKSSVFKKDSRWVIFPKLSYDKHLDIETIRNPRLEEEFSKSDFNRIEKKSKKGIISHGINHAYTKEALADLGIEHMSYMKLGTPSPIPEALVLDFLDGLDQVLVIEELSPYIEGEISKIIGINNLDVKVYGKRTGHIPHAGENSASICKKAISKYLNIEYKKANDKIPEEFITTRKPNLCAGCPHRASFYTVKEATSDMRAIYSGDIGCYTLGNSMPLDMVDTCLCMGAGFSMAQGLKRSEEDMVSFAFIGDSTFFHSGLSSVANAVYNQTDVVFVILDNGTTAMTGGQPSPATGQTMMEKTNPKIDIGAVLRGLGIENILKLRAFDVENNYKQVRQIAKDVGPRAIIFEDPCIKISKKEKPYQVLDSCIYCKTCIKELGCPAFNESDQKVGIYEDLCHGCGICAHLCPTGSIVEVD